MKVALIGAYDSHGFAPHWKGQCEALEELGIEYKTWDTRLIGFEDAGAMDRIILGVREFNPDVVIHGLSDCFKRDLLEELSWIPKKIWWYCDYADYKGIIGDPNVFRRGKIDGLIDLMLLSNREQIPFYEEKLGIPVKYMPQACLKLDKFEPNPIRDLVFAGERGGSIRQWRINFLRSLEMKYRIDFYPNERVTKEMCYGLLPEIYQQAKICIGESPYEDSDLYTSNRIFLTLGNGGFYLCKYFKNMEEVWNIGEHLDVFYTMEDGFDKIQYYLDHEEEREKIRKQGFEYCQKHHNYTVRMNNILDIINGKKDGFTSFVGDNTDH